ncbi:MAG: hypothetical protein KGY69_08980, partial [Bacteroidales bacterium]|nr:hypothetical protein [Bacteroidales bacterium]
MVKQSNQHLIHRHILDVTISPKRERSSIEEQLKTLLSRDAAPVVEQVFNKVSQDGDYIYIDKLEIDLGKLDPEALNRNLLTTLRQKLGEALNKLLDQESQTYQGSQTEILHNGKEITSGTSGKRQGTVIRYTYKQTLSNAFFHFLKTSMLPETMRTYALKELEKEMVRLQLTDAKLVEELRKLNKQIPYTTQRLAYQFSSRFLENLLENYGSFYKVYIDSGIKLFHDLLLNEAAGSETISDDVYTSFVEKMMVVFLEETEYNGTNRQDLIQSLLTRWYRDFLISQDKATKETIKRIIEKWQGQSSPNKDIFTGQLMNLLEKESEWPDEGTSEDKRASTDKIDTIIRQPGDNKTKNSDPHSKWPGENNEYQSQADHAGKSDSSSIENIKNLFHDD